jgi:hypothetical protein
MIQVAADTRPIPQPTTCTHPASAVGRQESAVPADWSAAVFVAAVWALTLLATVILILTYGSRLPSGDDWQVIPVLTGQEPITLSWFWSQVGREDGPGEHRWPLAKVFFILLARLSGYDFRAGLLFQAGALAVMALMMVGAARRLRGRVSPMDAFFPAVLLNWGHSENLLWWWQIVWVLPTVIAGSLLARIACRRAPLSRRAAVVVWAHLALLFLCGALGLAMIPALALWLAYSGWGRWRSGEPGARRDGLWIMVLAALALLLVPLYFVGFVGGTHRPNLANLHDIETWLKVAGQSLVMSLGAVGLPLWHELRWLVAGLALFGVAGLGLLRLRRPQECYRVAGLFFFLGALASVALGLAWGRFWGARDAGLAWRYSYLGLPALCCLYLSGVAWAAPAGRLLQMTLFTVACVLWPVNFQTVQQYVAFRQASMSQLERDVRQGMPPGVLAERHWGWQCGYYSPEYLAARLRMLRSAGVGDFRLLRADSTCREMPLPAVPVQVKDLVWANGEAVNFGDKPLAAFGLPAPRWVYAVRLKYRRDLGTPYPGLRVLWGVASQDAWTEAEPEPPHCAEDWTLQTAGAKAKEERLTVWVDGTMDQLRVIPDKTLGRLRITSMTLLVPEPGAER